MPESLGRISWYLLIPVLIVGYVSVMGRSGRCVACQIVYNSAVGLAGFQATAHAPDEPGVSPDTSRPAPSEPSSPADEVVPFQRVARPGSVDIEGTYDLSQPRIPIDEIHTLLPKDAIPALTDPATIPASAATWLPDQARVIAVTIGEGETLETLGVPLVILNWHEIVNTTVGGEPVAATYCPLCDSATVFSRRVGDNALYSAELMPNEQAETMLEFGVSGALYNSNVLMYDRSDLGLWSQLGMQAVSGVRSGTYLNMLPVQMMTFGSFKKTFAGAHVISNETGYERNYAWEERPYQDFFSTDKTLVPIRSMGKELPKKTLGVGISAGSEAWFVSEESLQERECTVETDLGSVTIVLTEAGIFVKESPPGVRTVQAFYYAWSAFYPETNIISEND